MKLQLKDKASVRLSVTDIFNTPQWKQQEEFAVWILLTEANGKAVAYAYSLAGVLAKQNLQQEKEIQTRMRTELKKKNNMKKIKKNEHLFNYIKST